MEILLWFWTRQSNSILLYTKLPNYKNQTMIIFISNYFSFYNYYNT